LEFISTPFLHNEEYLKLYSSPNNVGMMGGEMGGANRKHSKLEKNVYEVLIGKPLGRYRHRWKDTIKLI
jgi:hypothetical protein